MKNATLGAIQPRAKLRIVSILVLFAIFFPTASLLAADYPAPKEGDFTVRDFRFRSGESLPDLRMHYRTLGSPERDNQGVVRNAVLVLHGTTGSSTQFIRPEFAGELFGKRQLLDATRYFIIIPDNIGHGRSSKPVTDCARSFPDTVIST